MMTSDYSLTAASWIRCGDTESRSESASLPSMGLPLPELAPDTPELGKLMVESDIAASDPVRLPVMELVLAWNAPFTRCPGE